MTTGQSTWVLDPRVMSAVELEAKKHYNEIGDKIEATRIRLREVCLKMEQDAYVVAVADDSTAESGGMKT